MTAGHILVIMTEGWLYYSTVEMGMPSFGQGLLGVTEIQDADVRDMAGINHGAGHIPNKRLIQENIIIINNNIQHSDCCSNIMTILRVL